MTFKILSDKSSKIIYHLNIQPTDDLLEKNIRLEPLIILAVVKSKCDTHDEETRETSPSSTADNESSQCNSFYAYH